MSPPSTTPDEPPTGCAALRARVRSERGAAVPITMLLTVAILAVAGVATLGAVNAQRGTVRDQDVKLAIAAADAGVEAAILRQNQGDDLASSSSPCIVEGTGALAAAAAAPDGWCPAQTGGVGGASYTYRVLPADYASPGASSRQIEVVSTGTSDTVSRRISVTAIAPTGVSLFGRFGAIGDDRVTIDGAAIVNGLLNDSAVASNEDIVLRGEGGLQAAQLCAHAQPGHDGEFLINDGTGFLPDEQCLDPPFSFDNRPGFFPISPADQGTVAEEGNNNNDALEASLAYVGILAGDAWDPDARALSLSGGSILTMPGGDFSFCTLEMGGSSTLIVPGSAQARVFFDSPESCGLDDTNDLSPGNGVIDQIRVTGASSIVSVGLLPLPDDLGDIVDPPNIQFFVLGSDEVETSVYFAPTGGLQHQFTVWAPRSAVILSGVALYTGAVAGRTVLIGDDGIGAADAPVFTLDPHAANLDAGLITIYHRSRYVECSAASPPTVPNDRC